MRRITDPEYAAWQAMGSLPRSENYWIYFSPDNLSAALVSTINQEIIFISDRATGEEIYKSPSAKKHAQFFNAMKRQPSFQPRKII